MKDKQYLEKKHRIQLLFLFIGIAFAIFALSLVLVALSTYFLIVRTGLLSIVPQNLPGSGRLIIFMAIFSAAIALLMLLISEHLWLSPVHRLIEKMNRLAKGDYTVRIHPKPPIGRIGAVRMICDSFNGMAEELQGTALLHTDFINNFSHEFKTPIVSIAGFAKLLKKGKLSEEQKAEYIDIIEKESLRLSRMANNVLLLTDMEHKDRPNELSSYNLSEQLRHCILLLENKWTAKHLQLSLDFEEYTIYADREQMHHVFMNLLDNAVKFSPDAGTISVAVSADNTCTKISISNTSAPIPEEAVERLFQKFYQADESHAAEGSGIGLAIVQRIVALHGGTISVENIGETVTFTVCLPKA